jgi:hypothetical protein
MRNTGMKSALMKPALMRPALGLLSAVVSGWLAIGPAAAADMPSYPPPAPPPTGYYNPPVQERYQQGYQEGYVAQPPPPVYAYPAPAYRYYDVPPPVAVVPGPYYARPYYGWGYGRPFYGARRYAHGYAPYAAGRYHGYYR